MIIIIVVRSVSNCVYCCMCTCIFLLIFDKRKNCEEPDYCYIPTSLSLLYISIYNTLILTTLFFKGKYYDIVLIVIRYLWTCYCDIVWSILL